MPESLRSAFPEEHFRWFAYPHEDLSEEGLQLVRKTFAGALSCVQGDDSDRYRLNRLTVVEQTNLSRSSVSVIIPNYNYGHLLIEAVESVLTQTVPSDEILIIDDCSSDNSWEAMQLFANQAKLVRNEKNLGVIQNFNKAVSLTSGNYIAFVGADNKIRCDYVEKCRAALDANPRSKPGRRLP